MTGSYLPSAIPTSRQLEYQDWEFGLFLHFGIRTFYEGHKDWDGKPMTPADFNPKELDCDQWVATAKKAGVKYMVLVAKHHDGFANWPSKYTDFSVASSPWQDGKGDVVKEFTNACRRHDMKIGLYYSPADWQAPVYNDEKEYDNYFINQISEILTGYGEIDQLWFDGCGSENHNYDWGRIITEIRRMQPNILIFNMGDPNYRWVGNESGIAPMPCWNTVESVPFSVMTDKVDTVKNSVPTWLPAECDCMMRNSNWFYQDYDVDTVKSVEELIGLYYYSVGRGANLLINIGPDRRGLLPEPDATRLTGLGAEIQRRFSSPFADFDMFNDSHNGWEYSTTEDKFLIDHVVAMEDLTNGEHVRKFNIYATVTHGGEILVYSGFNIGHKAICRFPQIAARKIRLEITESDGPVQIRDIKLYKTS
jgi:alpha-L-fucosidase